MEVVFQIDVDESSLNASIQKIEARIHRELECYRVRGEWFQISPNKAIDKILEVVEGWQSIDDEMPIKSKRYFVLDVQRLPMEKLRDQVNHGDLYHWLNMAINDRILKDRKNGSINKSTNAEGNHK